MSLKRVSPLLERETATTRLDDVAPSPWVVRRCDESGLVFLENPPGYESLQSELAWEVTWQREADKRAADEPALYAMSNAAKRFRHRVLKRNKVADLATAIARMSPSPEIRLLDLGCGEGQLLGTVMDRLPQDIRVRCRPFGVEISNELARRSQAALASYGGDCVHASALQGLASFEAGFFDLIVMSSFLEHEIQPLPLRTLFANADIESSTACTPGTTSSPSTRITVPRGARRATCSTARRSVWLIFSPANIASMRARNPACPDSATRSPSVSSVTRCFE